MSRNELERRGTFASNPQRYRVLRPNEPLKNSWLLTLPGGSRDTVCVAGICKCGTNSFFYASPKKSFEPKYVCSICGNDSFIDVSEFVNMKKNSYWFDLSWSIETKAPVHNGDNYISRAYIKTPYFDATKKYISFTKKTLFSYELSVEGEFRESGMITNNTDCRIYKDGSFEDIHILIKDDLHSHLFSLIEKNPFNGIEFIFKYQKELDRLGSIEKISMCKFFFENRNCKEMDFYCWEHDFFAFMKPEATVKEMLDSIARDHSKSARKQLYKNYQELFQDGYDLNLYDPSSDYLFARIFKDSNHLLALLKVPYTKRVSLICTKNLSKLKKLLILLEERFTQKQIKDLFLGIFNTSSFDIFIEKVELFNDSLNMLDREGFMDHLSQNYPKHRLNIQQLHDAIIGVNRQYREKIKNIPIGYDAVTSKLEGRYKGVVFKLPKNTLEIANWGHTLHNCLIGYRERVYDKRSIILGVYKEDMLRYAIHISPMNFAIKEAKGKYNKAVTNIDMEIIYKWIELKKGTKKR